MKRATRGNLTMFSNKYNGSHSLCQPSTWSLTPPWYVNHGTWTVLPVWAAAPVAARTQTDALRWASQLGAPGSSSAKEGLVGFNLMLWFCSGSGIQRRKTAYGKSWYILLYYSALPPSSSILLSISKLCLLLSSSHIRSVQRSSFFLFKENMKMNYKESGLEGNSDVFGPTEQFINEEKQALSREGTGPSPQFRGGTRNLDLYFPQKKPLRSLTAWILWPYLTAKLQLLQC